MPNSDHLDSTLNAAENMRFNNIYYKIIRTETQKTQFSEIEVRCLTMIYHKFVISNKARFKFMTKKQLANLYMTLFQIPDVRTVEDTMLLLAEDAKIGIMPSAWIYIFSVYMSENLEKKIEFAYAFYTLSNPMGVITRQIVTTNVEKFFTSEDEEDSAGLCMDMAETIIKKFDLDKDGVITFDEYATIVRKQPMLLEFLGQIFPTKGDLEVIAHVTNLNNLSPK